MTGMILSYSLSYIIRPHRILRTIKSLFTDRSSTVVEQRFKDYLRKSPFFNAKIKPLVTKIFFKKISLKN